VTLNGDCPSPDLSGFWPGDGILCQAELSDISVFHLMEVYKCPESGHSSIGEPGQIVLIHWGLWLKVPPTNTVISE